LCHDSVPLELEARCARGLGERFYAPVKFVTSAVERDRFDAGLLGPFGDTLADLGRSLDVAPVLDVLAHLGLDRRSGREHFRAAGVDHLGINIAVRAVHGEADRPQLRDLEAGLARPAQTFMILVVHILDSRYFFLVSLITTCSPV